MPEIAAAPPALAKPSHLMTELPSPKINMLAAVNKVAALTHVTPRSVAFNMFRAAIGKNRIAPEDYFAFGLWRTDLTKAQRATYVTAKQTHAAIKGLIAPKPHNLGSLVVDKYLTGLVLTASGFDNPQPVAAFSPDRAFGSLRTLTTATELADYLADPARPAVFGKPVNGSRAVGATPVLAVQAGADSVGLGTGKAAPFAELADEIARNYPRGWLMQELIVQPVDVVDLVGSGISSLRVVTLWEKNGPAALYATWRIVAKGAVIDAAVTGPRVVAKIDLATGAVLQARLGNYLNGRDVAHSPSNPVRPLIGFVLPDWAQTVAMCCDAHRLFPGHGMLGWDIALSNRGPLVQEVNTSPHQEMYQLSHGQGFFSADILARLTAAKQELAARIARYGTVVRVAGQAKASQT